MLSQFEESKHITIKFFACMWKLKICRVAVAYFSLLIALKVQNFDFIFNIYAQIHL